MDYGPGAQPTNPVTRQTLQPTRSALQGPRVTDRGPWVRDLGQQEALRTYRDIPLFPALGIGIGAIMRDGVGPAWLIGHAAPNRQRGV